MFDNDGWISYDIDDFLNYLLTIEYDHHIPISMNTINRLKKAGWYEGRKIDISHIIEVCENNNVMLTQPQKDFLSEFAGIYNPDNNKNDGLLVVDNDSFGEGSEKYFLEKYKNLVGYQIIKMSIGYIQGQMDDLYLTPNGRLSYGSGDIGRTAMESWELLLN